MYNLSPATPSMYMICIPLKNPSNRYTVDGTHSINGVSYRNRLSSMAVFMARNISSTAVVPVLPPRSQDNEEEDESDSLIADDTEDDVEDSS
jgi:hypothetical protein